jgi:hypothetical protein
VARAGVVLREQDVARADRERRARFRLELERARQGDDEARDRVLVPLVRSARERLLKGQLDHWDRLANRVATHAAGKLDQAFLEQRVTILARPHPHTANHRHAPFTSTL